MKDISGYILIGVTLIGSLIAGTMRFSSLETRVASVESVQALTATKLDAIRESLDRIEGKLEAERDAK